MPIGEIQISGLNPAPSLNLTDLLPMDTAGAVTYKYTRSAQNTFLANYFPTISSLQSGSFTYAVDSGVADAYVVALTQAPSAYTDGLFLTFRAGNSNTGASTINVNGLGLKNIVTNANTALAGEGSEILAGGDYQILYNSTFGAFVLLNPSNYATNEVNENITALLGLSGGIAAPIGIFDSLSNYVLRFTYSPSAVNYVTVYNSPAGGGGGLQSNGADSSIPFGLQPKDADVWLNDSTHTIAAGIRYYNAAGNFYTALRANATQGANLDLVLPTADGSSGWAMVTDGAGHLSFSAVASALGIQDQSFTYAVDSGAANAYVIALSPAIGVYADGQYVAFKATNANTGASTIAVNGLTAQNIVTNANVALSGGEILAGGTYLLQYNSTFGAYVLVNSSASGGGVTAAQVQSQAFTYAVDSGAANAYVLTLSPALSSYVDGGAISFKAANNNTGASTINVNGLGTVAIQTNTGALVGGEILANQSYDLIYNSTRNAYILINSSLSAGGVTAAQIQTQTYNYFVVTGSPGAYVLTPSPALSAYADGVGFVFKNTAGTNSGSSSSTINVSGLGAVTLYNKLGIPIGRSSLHLDGVYTIVYSTAYSGFIVLDPGVSLDRSAPATGATITLSASTDYTIIDPSGTLATLTINMPTSPVDSQIQNFGFTHTITALTVSGNGATLAGAPTTAAPGQGFSFIYRASNTSWFPV